MYIEPNTNIKILKNVPLDTTYEHTIFFNNVNDQTLFFTGLTKYNLTNYTYQRVVKGKARVGIKADDLYDCNYMMFQNSNFGNKWFYAFINSVEYINNECSEITFIIDVMQTWHFDYEMGMCFVEREHVINDSIGLHIEPESIATGEYVFNNYTVLEQLTDMCVIIAVVDVDAESPSFGTLYDGIYGGAKLYVFNSADVNAINEFLSGYTQNYDSILSMYMIPKKLIGTIPADNLLGFGEQSEAINFEVDAVTADMTIDGYKPKNNKLYTYPYNFYHVDNASGSELTLRYEFFNNLKPTFRINGTITQPIEIILRPIGYKGVNPNTPLYTESLKLSNYPLCSWNVDTYQAWVAQNSIPLLAGGIKDTFVGAVTGGIGGAIGGAFNAITNAVSQAYQASISADICKGSFNNGSANVANHTQNFYGGRCSVSAEYARIIDDYFNMFGYAVRVCKTPNRSSRPHWNYVKTVGAIIKGSVPADDMRSICQIYDKGITFWNNGNEVGQYTYDNSMPS